MQNLLPCFVILSNAFLFLVQEFGLSTPPPASTPTVRSGEEKLPDNCPALSLVVDRLRATQGKTLSSSGGSYPLRSLHGLVFKYAYTHFGVTFISSGRVGFFFFLIVWCYLLSCCAKGCLTRWEKRHTGPFRLLGLRPAMCGFQTAALCHSRSFILNKYFIPN